MVFLLLLLLLMFTACLVRFFLLLLFAIFGDNLRYRFVRFFVFVFLAERWRLDGWMDGFSREVLTFVEMVVYLRLKNEYCSNQVNI